MLWSFPRRIDISRPMFPSLLERVGDSHVRASLLLASIISSLNERFFILLHPGRAVCGDLRDVQSGMSLLDLTKVTLIYPKSCLATSLEKFCKPLRLTNVTAP